MHPLHKLHANCFESSYNIAANVSCCTCTCVDNDDGPSPESPKRVYTLSKRQKKIFDEAMKRGSIKPKRFKLNVVGRDRSGKSCFVDALLNVAFDHRNEKVSTDGVAIDVAMLNTEGWTKEKQGVCC